MTAYLLDLDTGGAYDLRVASEALVGAARVFRDVANAAAAEVERDKARGTAGDLAKANALVVGMLGRAAALDRTAAALTAAVPAPATVLPDDVDVTPAAAAAAPATLPQLPAALTVPDVDPDSGLPLSPQVRETMARLAGFTLTAPAATP